MNKFKNVMAVMLVGLVASSSLYAAPLKFSDTKRMLVAVGERGVASRIELDKQTVNEGNYQTHGVEIGVGTEGGGSFPTERLLSDVRETNIGSLKGLGQTFNYYDRVARIRIPFLEEYASISNMKLFRTTKDINKVIIPTNKILKQYYFESPYYKGGKDPVTNPFMGYTIETSDAIAFAENYMNRNIEAYYYHKAISTMPYEGEYDADGKRSGYGKLYNMDGEVVYMGMWENNTFSGYGISFYNDEMSYIGQWQDGYPLGIGAVNCAFQNRDKKNGNQVYRYFFINELNNVNMLIMSSKYAKVLNMPVPFSKKETVFTVNTVDEKKLRKIVDNYETEFVPWSKKKYQDIMDYDKLAIEKGWKKNY